MNGWTCCFISIIFSDNEHLTYQKVLYRYLILKVLSNEKKGGSYLVSMDRYWFNLPFGQKFDHNQTVTKIGNLLKQFILFYSKSQAPLDEAKIIAYM